MTQLELAKEGTISPTFERGQVLPLMSSFSSSTNAFNNFLFGVGSTFSTGEAAVAMSYLYDDPDYLRHGDHPLRHQFFDGPAFRGRTFRNFKEKENGEANRQINRSLYRLRRR